MIRLALGHDQRKREVKARMTQCLSLCKRSRGLLVDSNSRTSDRIRLTHLSRQLIRKKTERMLVLSTRMHDGARRMHRWRRRIRSVMCVLKRLSITSVMRSGCTRARDGGLRLGYAFWWKELKTHGRRTAESPSPGPDGPPSPARGRGDYRGRVSNQRERDCRGRVSNQRERDRRGRVSNQPALS